MIGVEARKEDNLRRFQICTLDKDANHRKIPAVNHYPPITEWVYKWSKRIAQST
jgi:hypothetical protein